VLDDFKKFLLRGNVIDLAVAVIIGAAITANVTPIVAGRITPRGGMGFSKDF
jgi:large conductance mechanosensitive channel